MGSGDASRPPGARGESEGSKPKTSAGGGWVEKPGLEPGAESGLGIS